jgi:metal-responsive CopG/Arc/MetJ family transcriptional regulator
MASNRTKNKKLVSYTIDTKLLFEFNEHCKKNSINKSMFIENFIKNVLQNNSK